MFQRFEGRLSQKVKLSPDFHFPETLSRTRAAARTPTGDKSPNWGRAGISKILLCNSTTSEPLNAFASNDLIYYLLMGVKLENGIKWGFEDGPSGMRGATEYSQPLVGSAVLKAQSKNPYYRIQREA